MTKHDLETVAQLTRELPDLSPYAVVGLYLKLRRDARTIQRLAEEGCNRELHPNEIRMMRRAEQRLRDRWHYVSGRYPTFSGDPRGYVVKLILPSGASNNMGGEGWGIA